MPVFFFLLADLLTVHFVYSLSFVFPDFIRELNGTNGVEVGEPLVREVRGAHFAFMDPIPFCRGAKVVHFNHIIAKKLKIAPPFSLGVGERDEILTGSKIGPFSIPFAHAYAGIVLS